MKTRLLLSMCTIAVTSVAAAAAQTPDLRPMSVTGMTGSLRVQQDVPCADDVDRTTPLTAGLLELTPAGGFPVTGGRLFTLTRGNLTFAGFSVTRSCLGIERTRTYGDIRVQLARAVSFTAASTGTPNVFAVAIPRTTFQLLYATIADGSLETGTKIPSQDVTGTIDLVRGTITMHVVLATRVHFEAGCVDGLGCIINETDDGSLTADLTGTIVYPDTDGDGIADRSDNCRFVANPDQSTVATPVLTVPPNVTLASCLSRNFGFARGVDVCDATRVSISSNAPTQFSRGANVMTWTGRDGFDRLATGTQTVTIVDTTAPTFSDVPPNVSMTDCGPAALGVATATDDCTGAVTVGNNAPPEFFVGTTPVTWTATDVSGNSATATQAVTVVDTVAPTVFCVATNPTGSSYRVAATDSCTSTPVIRLGSYVLGDGETIMINETGQPGVRLVNSIGSAGIRHFQVGRGQAVITATDPSGNVGMIACPVR